MYFNKSLLRCLIFRITLRPISGQLYSVSTSASANFIVYIVNHTRSKGVTIKVLIGVKFDENL